MNERIHERTNERRTNELSNYCMDELNVLRADVYPRVTEYVDNIVEMIDRLLENGNAYVWRNVWGR